MNGRVSLLMSMTTGILWTMDINRRIRARHGIAILRLHRNRVTKIVESWRKLDRDGNRARQHSIRPRIYFLERDTCHHWPGVWSTRSRILPGPIKKFIDREERTNEVSPEKNGIRPGCIAFWPWLWLPLDSNSLLRRHIVEARRSFVDIRLIDKCNTEPNLPPP